MPRSRRTHPFLCDQSIRLCCYKLLEHYCTYLSTGGDFDLAMISFNEDVYQLVLACFKPRVLSLLKATSLPTFKGARMLVLKRSVLLCYFIFLFGY